MQVALEPVAFYIVSLCQKIQLVNVQSILHKASPNFVSYVNLCTKLSAQVPFPPVDEQVDEQMDNEEDKQAIEPSYTPIYGPIGSTAKIHQISFNVKTNATFLMLESKPYLI